MSKWHPLRHLLLATSALVPLGFMPALANPLGGTVVGGSATINGVGTNNVVINQQTQRTIINWQTFNIGAGQSVNFNQPGSTSIALNRVTGGMGPSSINGVLDANGRVFLVNPNGLLIGRGASINTAGFLATTSDISNENFMAGRYQFNIPGRPDASIVNLGTINAHSHGFAALVAPGVRNSGTITARFGTIGLASANAFSLDFYGDELIKLAPGDAISATVRDVETGLPLNALVKNEGLLRANGGRVELTAAAARTVVDSVINNTGVIEARSIGHRNGKIVLGGSTADNGFKQTVKVSGKLDVSSKKAKGGKIQVTGQHIEIKAASFDASGATGGGTVLIGGDTGGGHGHAAAGSIPQAALEAGAVPNATTVSIDAGTVINASATGVGNGGKVIVWADGHTAYSGLILAGGGVSGGDGGFVEVSGKDTLAFLGGMVDTSAPFGMSGTLLLDPTDYTVGAASNSANEMMSSTLQALLAVQNVTIVNNAGAGNGDIFVVDDVTWSSSSTLTLNAFRHVSLSAGVTISNTGAGSLVVRADVTGIGSGNIIFNHGTAGARVDWTNSTGFVRFYENPPGGYSNPTDFRPSGQGGGTRGVTTNNSVSNQFISYMLVNDATDLQNMVDPGGAALRGSYALGRDFAGGAFTTHTWTFRGDFDGLGHTISGLVINGPGLFQANSGTFRNLTLNATVNATANNQVVGLLVGQNNFNGLLINVHTSGAVNGGNFTGAILGGLVGQNNGTITNSSSSAAVSSTANVPPVDCNNQSPCPYVYAGGLVGMNSGIIQGINGTFTTFATGSVSVGSNGIGGGLVGFNGGIIDNAMASGSVTGAAGVPGSSDQFDKATILGGFVGTNTGSIWDSSATGNVGAAGVDYLRAGGFVGDNTGLIGFSSATGNVVTGNFGEAGGFAGAGGGDDCFLCVIGFSTASGSVTVGASSLAGGFAGSSSTTIASEASGAVTGGAGSILGGFTGVVDPEVTIAFSSASGSVTGTGANSWIGGFAGFNIGVIIDSVASGAVSGTSNSILGGFAAVNVGWIDPSTAFGSVSASGNNNILGGFAGLNLGTIDFATSFGSVTVPGSGNTAGSLVGVNASFVNLPSDLLPFSSFPFGTVNSSMGFGSVSVGSGGVAGAQIASTSPGQLPGLPAVLENCVHLVCSIFRSGQFGAGDGTLIPNEVRAIPNLMPPWTDRTQDQPQVLIRIIPGDPAPPAGGAAGGAPTGSQVPGTPPNSLAPPPAYIRDNGLPSGLPPITETRFNQSQVLVQFPANVSQDEMNRIAQQFGLTILSTTNVGGGVTVQFQLGGQQNVRNMIRALERLRELGTVQPNYTYRVLQADRTTGQATPQAIPPTATTVPRGDPAQYMMGKLHLSDAHRIASGINVLVAVIDSEVDREHAELAGTIVERFDATDSPARAHSHGTAMAGAIVSRDRLLGVAPGARILAIRAFSESQTSAESTSLTILKSIEWAVNRGARIINMSFAGPYDPTLAKALKDAAAKGVILIAASGNAGPKSPPLWPSADPNVIAVTATDSSDRLFRQANRGPYVSVASPGVEILAPAPQAGYQMSTGTSIATAHVSGIVALMLERDPTLTPRDVRLILESTAADLGPKGRDTQYGWGLVSPQRALALVEERKRQRGGSATKPAQTPVQR